MAIGEVRQLHIVQLCPQNTPSDRRWRIQVRSNDRAMTSVVRSDVGVKTEPGGGDGTTSSQHRRRRRLRHVLQLESLARRLLLELAGRRLPLRRVPALSLHLHQPVTSQTHEVML